MIGIKEVDIKHRWLVRIALWLVPKKYTVVLFLTEHYKEAGVVLNYLSHTSFHPEARPKNYLRLFTRKD